jgi:hypothetical protein
MAMAVTVYVTKKTLPVNFQRDSSSGDYLKSKIHEPASETRLKEERQINRHEWWSLVVKFLTT